MFQAQLEAVKGALSESAPANTGVTPEVAAPAEAVEAPSWIVEWMGPWAVEKLDAYPQIYGLVIVLAACVLAKVLDWIVTSVVLRLAGRTKLRIDDQVVALLHAPLMRSVILLGLAFAVGPFGLEGAMASTVQRILFTLAIFTWVPFGFKVSSLLLGAAADDDKYFRVIGTASYPLFDNLAKLIIFAAFTYGVFIATWKVDPAGFLASAGIVGLAVGFAAQDTLANLFAGAFILADAPYRVGDFITLDTGERGAVRHIGLRSTRLLTRDDIEITIPNSIMGSAKITNEAGGPSSSHRIGIDVSAAYGADIDVVRKVLLESAQAVDSIVDDPAPRVRFKAFGASGLDFRLYGWIRRPVDRGSTLDKLHVDVYKRFAANNLEIPYPKRDVYLHHVSDDGNE